jgi:hypothetical protein
MAKAKSGRAKPRTEAPEGPPEELVRHPAVPVKASDTKVNQKVEVDQKEPVRSRHTVLASPAGTSVLCLACTPVPTVSLTPLTTIDSCLHPVCSARLPQRASPPTCRARFAPPT